MIDSPRGVGGLRLGRGLLLGAVVVLVGQVACGSDDAATNGPAASGGAAGGGLSGRAGTSSGGTTNAGGKSGAGAIAGSAGASNGGSNNGGSNNGTAGTANGGSNNGGSNNGTAGTANGGSNNGGSNNGTAGTANGGSAGSAKGGSNNGSAGTANGGSNNGSAGAANGGSNNGSAGAANGGSSSGSAGAANGGSNGGTEPPPLGENACSGYATRYWDCCKAHCAWTGNVPANVKPVQSCNAADQPLTSSNAADTKSSCDGPSADSAFTCNSMAPWRVSDTLSYGFAAVPATGDICGRCYQLAFTGKSFNAGDDAGSAALAKKTMIVQATNIGHDVGNGQFDVLIPGGGVGAFNACSFQWKANDLGAQYGGFLLQCKQNAPNAGHAANKACVKAKCAQVFADASLSELRDACDWYVDWYEAADNPALRYAEVACPDAIVKASGVDRRPLNDIAACGKPGGSSCSQAQQDDCNCAWTNGGANCGQDDGSCCWKACCGPK